MDFFKELRELRGNQGGEEEEGVIAAEPIAMIVPPCLQDFPETMTPESSASSSAGDNGDGHHASPSSSSPSGDSSNHEEEPKNVGGNEHGLPAAGEWENKGGASSRSSGQRALNKWVQEAGGDDKRVPNPQDNIGANWRAEREGLLSVADGLDTCLTPNSVRFIVGFMLLCARLEVPAKAIVFRLLFQCPLCPNAKGAKWYYLSGRNKSQLFKNVRNKVARWKRQFIFVRDTRTEKVSNDLAARLSEWRTPNAHVNYPQLLPRDTDLKNRLLEHARRENLVDLEALVTPKLLAVFGRNEQHSRTPTPTSTELTRRGPGSTTQRQTRFDERPPTAPQSRSSSHRGSSSASRPRAEHKADAAAWSACRRAREENESEEDEVPLAQRRTSGGTQPAQVACPAIVRSPNAPSVTARAVVEPASASASMSGPRIAYLEGFSYVRVECQPAMLQAMHSFVPPADSRRAKAFVQQHGGQVAMIKLMDAFNYAVVLYESEQEARSQNNELGSKCKQLAAEKASLVDDVNRLQCSKMANRAAAVEIRADELAHRNNELRKELERARAEKESGIHVAKDEAARIEERAKKAEADRDHAQHELSSLRHQVAEADWNLTATGEALNKLKTSHARSDAVAVASANVTTKIYNEIRGKVLQHRPDFPIGELAFFDGEDLNEQGKSLAPFVDATVWLRWDLNKEGVPVWPPQVLGDGEDPTGLPSFDAWVKGAPVAEQEPSSTLPNSQPAVVPASSPVSTSASEPAARSTPARSPAAAADASMPVDLTVS
ncbi:hypothetical protein SLEP1_g57360 [Rubroshorea leprosula]|uniref:Uncharacterized protein n=1 Tax=Rubroshorea leprosula TaxID=152421 RepID=A0AAV5ML18_9ROSI|nr:hypothetical protein SLEP1_g57360 [Rubroshorea leprosula]